MKKTLCSVLAVIACFSMLTGCAGDTESSGADVTSEASVTSEAEKEQTTKATTSSTEEKAPTEDAPVNEPTSEPTVEPEPTEDAPAEPIVETSDETTEESTAPSTEPDISQPATDTPDEPADTPELEGSFDAAQIPEAYCAEEYGNIILGMPAEGYSMRMIYVFDDSQTLVDTVIHLIPGEITTLEEMFEGAEIDAPIESFTFENGYYTASAGLADVVSTGYDDILQTSQYTAELYNMLLSWSEQVEQENANVSSAEYTVTVELVTANEYQSIQNDDGSFSIEAVPVPAIEIEAKIKTDVEFDDLTAPAVSIDIDGATTELESYGKSKSGGVAAWSFSHIIGDDTFETVTVTVDGTEYSYTYAELS